MTDSNFPIPNDDNIEIAFEKFSANTISDGVSVAEVATLGDTTSIDWLVSYIVLPSSTFPTPSGSNCQSAKSQFQRHVPSGLKIRSCFAKRSKASGELISRWMVTYSNLGFDNLPTSSGELVTHLESGSNPRSVNCKCTDRNAFYTECVISDDTHYQVGDCWYEISTKECKTSPIKKTLKNQFQLKQETAIPFITKSNVLNFKTTAVNKFASKKKKNVFHYLLRKFKSNKINNKPLNNTNVSGLKDKFDNKVLEIEDDNVSEFKSNYKRKFDNKIETKVLNNGNYSIESIKDGKVLLNKIKNKVIFVKSDTLEPNKTSPPIYNQVAYNYNEIEANVIYRVMKEKLDLFKILQIVHHLNSRCRSNTSICNQIDYKITDLGIRDGLKNKEILKMLYNKVCDEFGIQESEVKIDKNASITTKIDWKRIYPNYKKLNLKPLCNSH